MCVCAGTKHPRELVLKALGYVLKSSVFGLVAIAGYLMIKTKKLQIYHVFKRFHRFSKVFDLVFVYTGTKHPRELVLKAFGYVLKSSIFGSSAIACYLTIIFR